MDDKYIEIFKDLLARIKGNNEGFIPRELFLKFKDFPLSTVKPEFCLKNLDTRQRTDTGFEKGSNFNKGTMKQQSNQQYPSNRGGRGGHSRGGYNNP